MERHKEKYAEEMELKALEADPMNPELQKKIEERVRTLHVLVVADFISCPYLLLKKFSEQ